MSKLIILNSNLESIKNLCNHILNEIPDVQLSGFSTNIEEFDNLFTKVKPNIIMMNYSDYIHSKYHKSNFKNLKIILCGTPHSYKCSSSQISIPKNASITEIKKSISEVVSNESVQLLRKKIIKWLETFHFDFKLIGTTYLLECILYCYENKSDYVSDNLEKNVYPEVAKLYNISFKSVKWSVVRSIKNMHSHINLKQLSDSLNLYLPEKVTAKQLINTIIAKLN